MKSICRLLLLLFACHSNAQNIPVDTLIAQAKGRNEAGDVTGATTLFLQAQKIAEAANDVKKLCQIQVGMGKTALISENNEAAAKAIALAEKYCLACGDTFNLARMNLQKGILLIKKNDLEAAVESFKRSAGFYLAKRDTMGSANALAKLGNVLERQGRYKEAQEYYLKFYEATRKSPSSAAFLTANIYLTGNYLYLNQFEKALFHNNLAKALAKKLNANFEYSNTLRYDALIHKEMGQCEKAFDELNDQYLRYYQDTLMNNQRLQEVEELKTKYETEKKETLIALQNEQLQEGRFRFWAVTLGLLLSVAIGFVFFILARRLRKRNEEKEFLIKEIHHRVKNNLQILSSLLHLQSRRITDDTALDAVREGQSRVDAMGLIHQKLYMGDNVARVDMKEYLEQFGQNMLDSFGIENNRVTITYDLKPMMLDVDTAIPLGLIINELVTNSLKYAFPENRSGVINIALWEDNSQHLCLKVTDNGVGQASAADLKNSTSFGASLIQMLSKKLKGKTEILKQEQGYGTLIVFEAPGGRL
jgi:two-component sensor histidine kinase